MKTKQKRILDGSQIPLPIKYLTIQVKQKKEIKQNQFYKYTFYGEGNNVIYQSPEPDEKIKEGDTIMFYLG